MEPLLEPEGLPELSGRTVKSPPGPQGLPELSGQTVEPSPEPEAQTELSVRPELSGKIAEP